MSKARTYAMALMASLKDGKDVEGKAARFRQLLKKRGDTRLMGSILKEAARIAQLQEGKKARLVTSRKLSEARRKDVDELFSGLGWVLEEEVSPKVMGGAALFLEDSVLIDGTVNKRLAKIFQ